MLELLLAFALTVAASRAVVVRRGSALAAALLTLYLLIADTMNVFASAFSDLHPLHAFIFMLLGPSMWHLRGDGPVPLPPFMHAPLLLRGARICVCAAVAWHCTREATAVNPLLPRSQSLQWLATPFVGAAVIDAAEGVLLLTARYIAPL